MAWAKFKRIDDSNNIDDIDFEDGAFIVTGDGKSYIDYDNDRILISSGIGEALPVGSEVDYDGDDVPTGWEKVDDVPRYSLDETVCGTWIDGKPIYRKVMYISAFPNNAELQIDINSLNLEYLVHLYGFAGSGGAGNNGFPINASRPDNLSAEVGAWLNIANDNNVVIIRSGSDRSGFSGYIILEYTKTTD